MAQDRRSINRRKSSDATGLALRIWAGHDGVLYSLPYDARKKAAREMMKFTAWSPGAPRGGCAARFRNLVPMAVVAMASLTALSAQALPLTAIAKIEPPAVSIEVSTTCDTRGCFTFGPRQSYQRPNYRPLGQTGPRYYSPGARPPRFIFRPQPPRLPPKVRVPAADPSFHRQSCMNRYRSYDPLTDSYKAPGGRPVRCVLPERR